MGMISAGNVLLTTKEKRFYARGSAKNGENIVIDLCSDPDLGYIPKGVYEVSFTVKRTSGIDDTTNNYLTEELSCNGEVFYTFSDSISGIMPAKTDVTFQHNLLVEITENRPISQFRVTVKESGEKSDNINIYIYATEVG